MPVMCVTMVLFSTGLYRQDVSNVAALMLEAVRKFSEKHQATDLALIQIVIFDSSMCNGFAQALQSAVKDSQSLWVRAKRKYSKSVTLCSWASAHSGKWGQLPPWKNGGTIKKQKHAKRALFCAYVIF